MFEHTKFIDAFSPNDRVSKRTNLERSIFNPQWSVLVMQGYQAEIWYTEAMKNYAHLFIIRQPIIIFGNADYPY